MRPWFFSSVGAAIFIAIHFLFLRNASGRINDVLGALVLEGSATLGITLAYLLGLRGELIAPSRAGLASAILSGFAISVASILLFVTLRRGGPVASTGTVVMGGGVALSALLAPWIFHEPFSARRVIGVALGLAAMFVLSNE